jgi:hypothetical protein
MIVPGPSALRPLIFFGHYRKISGTLGRMVPEGPRKGPFGGRPKTQYPMLNHADPTGFCPEVFPPTRTMWPKALHRPAVQLMAIAFLSTVSTASGAGRLKWPLDPDSSTHNVITSYGQFMGYSVNYVHVGIDIAGRPGQAVHAVQDGVVRCFSNRGQGALQWFLVLSLLHDSTKGWGYGHLDHESVPFSLGDTVHAGDSLGTIVTWPDMGFHHTHLAYYHNLTSDTSKDFQGGGHPLDLLKSSGDTKPPAFHNAAGSTFYFYDYYTRLPISATTLRGRVMISVGVHDSTYNPTWQTGIYSLRYWIDGADGLAKDTSLSAIFNFALGDIAHSNELAEVFYDTTKSTRFAGYYWLGSMNDSGFSGTKDEENFDTRSLNDGEYWLYVEAQDYAGNSRRDSVRIAARNATAASPVSLARERERQTGCSIVMGGALYGNHEPRQDISWRVFDLEGRLMPEPESRRYGCGVYAVMRPRGERYQ